jgi:hypothetical protein
MCFNILLDNDFGYADDAYWVKMAWRHEDMKTSTRMECANGGMTIGWNLSRYIEKRISLVKQAQLSKHFRRKELIQLLWL